MFLRCFQINESCLRLIQAEDFPVHPFKNVYENLLQNMVRERGKGRGEGGREGRRKERREEGRKLKEKIQISIIHLHDYEIFSIISTEKKNCSVLKLLLLLIERADQQHFSLVVCKG